MVLQGNTIHDTRAVKKSQHAIRMTGTGARNLIGMNSIAIYCLAHLIEGFIIESFRIHLGAGFFDILGQTFAPAVRGLCVVGTLWLILYWMYRRKLFLRI